MDRWWWWWDDVWVVRQRDREMCCHDEEQSNGLYDITKWFIMIIFEIYVFNTYYVLWCM